MQTSARNSLNPDEETPPVYETRHEISPPTETVPVRKPAEPPLNVKPFEESHRSFEKPLRFSRLLAERAEDAFETRATGGSKAPGYDVDFFNHGLSFPLPTSFGPGTPFVTAGSANTNGIGSGGLPLVIGQAITGFLQLQPGGGGTSIYVPGGFIPGTQPGSGGYIPYQPGIPGIPGGTLSGGGDSAGGGNGGVGGGSSPAPSEPVPEPETYALMLAGLGVVFVAAQRRRSGNRPG